jgi:anti-anti-sigma regulatory factor
MSGPQAYLEVARAEDAVYVRVHGYGSFAVAKPLREFTEAGLAAGCRKFLIDLSDAASCDSTFLGVLAGLAAQTGGEGWIQLINANPQTTKVMTDIGITRMMRLRTDPVELPDVPLQRLEAELGTPQERVRTAAEAHRNLLPLDAENEARFRGVLDILERELDALEGEDS